MSGVRTPTKGRRGVRPHQDEVTRNQLLAGMRAEAERVNAALKVRWREMAT